jgi:ribonucleotide reductase beta subunit family protein with ferritin-like domain
MAESNIVEPLLIDSNNKYVKLPVHFHDIEKFHTTQVDLIWHVNEIDLTTDLQDWVKLNDDEKLFIKHILAFFSASDGIVMKNISTNFANEIQHSEAISFYAAQNFIEDIHAQMYSKLIVTYIPDLVEQNRLLNAINTIPAIAKKAQWAEKWISSDASLGKRLLAFAIVEGIFFSAAFLAIYWISEKQIMKGLCASNSFIARDEALHVEFAVLLYTKYVVNKLSQEEVTELIIEAVNIEKEFIIDSIPCKLLGINSAMMSEYIEFVSHRLMVQFGYTSPYGSAKCLFPFMDKISLASQTNFFDEVPTEYRKNKTVQVLDAKNIVLNFDDDF